MGISLRLRPLGVLVPFLITPEKADMALRQPSSPSSSARVPQNSSKNSLGSLSTSSFFFPKPKEDLRLDKVGASGDGGVGGMGGDLAGQSGDLLEKLNVNLEPEGDDPCMAGEGTGEWVDALDPPDSCC